MGHVVVSVALPHLLNVEAEKRQSPYRLLQLEVNLAGTKWMVRREVKGYSIHVSLPTNAYNSGSSNFNSRLR